MVATDEHIPIYHVGEKLRLLKSFSPLPRGASVIVKKISARTSGVYYYSVIWDHETAVVQTVIVPERCLAERFLNPVYEKPVEIFEPLKYLVCKRGWLICDPYSTKNLHRMAKELKISKSFFEKDHYNVPKRRHDEIIEFCYGIRVKDMLKFMNGETSLEYDNE